MKRIAFAVYREWSYEIFSTVVNEIKSLGDVSIPLLITTPGREFDLPNKRSFIIREVSGKNQAELYQTLKENDIDTVCFYGWSWLVKSPILEEFTCLCLHPSPLPRYRGGTPIQHQLVAGEITSAVSIIKMSEGIDDGDIYMQIPISFEGYLPQILERMIKAGVEGTKAYIADLVSGKVYFTPQKDLEKFPPLKRRTPEDGEVKIDGSKDKPYTSIYNLVRGLQPPYPNAYISLNNNTILVDRVEYTANLSNDNLLLSRETDILTTDKTLALRTSDGYALFTKYRILQ